MSDRGVISLAAAMIVSACIVAVGFVNNDRGYYKEGYVVTKTRIERTCEDKERDDGKLVASCSGPHFEVLVKNEIGVRGSFLKDTEYYKCPLGYALWKKVEEGQYLVCPHPDYQGPLWEKEFITTK